MKLPDQNYSPPMTPSFRHAADIVTLDWLKGAKVQILVDSISSARQLSVMTIQAEEGYAADSHVHSIEDEIFYIVRGAILVQVGTIREELQSGGIAFLPKGEWHQFLVTAANTLFLNICVPGGLDGFFRDVSSVLPDVAASPTKIAAHIRRVGAYYGLTYQEPFTGAG